MMILRILNDKTETDFIETFYRFNRKNLGKKETERSVNELI